MYFEQAFLAALLIHKTAVKDLLVRFDYNNQDYNNRLDSCNYHCNYSHSSSDYIHFPSVPVQEESDADPQVLMLDYRLGKGEEDPLTLAPLYEEKLDTVSSLSIKTDALTVETKYSKVKDMLLSWIKNDIAVYLQNMSSAISQNNSETAQNALQDKDRVYSDFSLITQNLVAMGENLQGVDLTDVKQWTPEDYVDEQINGE